MFKMEKFAVLTVLVLVLFLTSCNKEQQPESSQGSPSVASTVAVKMEGKDLMLEDIRRYINSLPDESRKAVLSKEEMFRLMINDMVRVELLYKEAIKKGYDKDPEILRKLEEIKKKMLIAKVVEEEINKKLLPSEKEIKEYYEKNIDLFTAPEEIKLSHIVVKTKEVAEEIIKKLQEGESFEDLAKKYSIDTKSAAHGGDLGFFTKDTLIDELKEPAFSLKVGSFSKTPVKTRLGYHILKVTKYVPPKRLTLEEVREQIIEDIIRAEREKLFKEYMEKLKKKYNVKIEWRNIESLRTNILIPDLTDVNTFQLKKSVE